jgi:hypothetical protein
MRSVRRQCTFSEELMQTMLAAAGVLSLATGLAHSVLGEALIFRHVRVGSLVPTIGAPPLRERNIRIIWATWHLATVFGWAFAAILFKLAITPHNSSLGALILDAIVVAHIGGALLVLIGTKGRHPGWIALAAVAALTWFGASAA